MSLIICQYIIHDMRDDKQPDDEKTEKIAAVLRIIVSYDAGKWQRAEAVAIQRFVHGRKVTAKVDGRKKKYFYPGLTSRPDVDRLGQSVLMMREKDAEDFIAFLRRLSVQCDSRRVWIRPESALGLIDASD
jgi:hypothetical protein